MLLISIQFSCSSGETEKRLKSLEYQLEELQDENEELKNEISELEESKSKVIYITDNGKTSPLINQYQTRPQSAKKYVYCTVDYEFHDAQTNGYFGTPYKQGKGCTKVITVSPNKISKLKNDFFMSTAVQYYSIDASDSKFRNGYFTLPKTVSYKSFDTFDEAVSNQKKKCQQFITTYSFFDY